MLALRWIDRDNGKQLGGDANETKTVADQSPQTDAQTPDNRHPFHSKGVPIFETVLILATLLCSLVAGFLFAFAVVVMPGIKALSDRDYVRAFQVMDGVIQNNQPAFMLVWVGSVLAVVAAPIVGYSQLEQAERITLIAATVIYLLGVQLPTMAVNVPLNNALQSLDVESIDDTQAEAARMAFEQRWNRSNIIRTLLAVAVSAALIFVVYRTGP